MALIETAKKIGAGIAISLGAGGAAWFGNTALNNKITNVQQTEDIRQLQQEMQVTVGRFPAFQSSLDSASKNLAVFNEQLKEIRRRLEARDHEQSH